MNLAPPQSAAPHLWLRPLPLPGGHVLPNRILPGPMEGITGGAFCAAMRAFDLVDAWITPFIRVSTGVPRRTRLEARLAPFLAPGALLPLVVQVMGTDTGRLAGTAARLAEIPGVVGIDLNCACPSPAVVASGAGGARLRDPPWIARTLAALRTACPRCAISVKLRTGCAAAAELPAILAAVRAAAPDLVVLHFRTVAELYREVPEGWERLARARDLLPGQCLFGSGDLFTATAALDLGRRAALDGVTPARGLLRNPWLLRDIAALCRGDDPPPRPPGAGTAFLAALLAAAEADGTWRPGFVLEVARHLFGVETPRFRALAAARSAAAMREALARG